MATWTNLGSIVGPAGPAGADGKTVLNGAGVPASGLGVDGDYYIDNTAHAIYGPKTSGVWGSATSLIGAAGSTGPVGATGSTGLTGATGSTGTRGSLWYTGSGPPGVIAGELVNDLYLDTSGGNVYQYV